MSHFEHLAHNALEAITSDPEVRKALAAAGLLDGVVEAQVAGDTEVQAMGDHLDDIDLLDQLEHELGGCREWDNLGAA